MAREGMRVLELSRELRYCLRELGLAIPPQSGDTNPQIS
jgi:hypothetical protein